MPSGESPPPLSSPSSSPAAARNPARRRADRRPWPLLAALALLASVAAAATGALAYAWSAFDPLNDPGPALLAGHYAAFMAATFVFHAGLAMLPVAVFALLTRRLRLAAFAGLLAILAAGPELATSLARRSPSTRAPGDLTLLSANVMYGRADAPSLLDLVNRHAPDVIVVQEWTPSAARALKPALAADYPHIAEVVRDDAFGQAVFSKRPWLSPPMHHPPATGIGPEPQITVTIDHEGRPLRITNVHTLPPVGPSHFRAQRRTAAALSSWCRTDGGPHILAGDFNAVGASSVMRAFSRAGLLDAHDQVGGHPRLRATTWPRTGMLRHAPGIRLDHVLHAPSLRAVEATVCRHIGSDHTPIVARLRWAQ